MKTLLKGSVIASLVLGLNLMSYAFAYPNGPVANHIAAHKSPDVETVATAPSSAPTEVSMTEIMNEIAMLTNSENQTIVQQKQAMLNSISQQANLIFQQAQIMIQDGQMQMMGAITAFAVSIVATGMSVYGAGAAMTSAKMDEQLETEQAMMLESEASTAALQEKISETNSQMNELLNSMQNEISATSQVLSEMANPLVN